MYKTLLKMLLGKAPTEINVSTHKPAPNFTVGKKNRARFVKILNLRFSTNLLDGLTSSIQNQGCG